MSRTVGGIRRPTTRLDAVAAASPKRRIHALSRVRFAPWLVAVVAASAASSAPAELIFTEPFQYPIGSNLAGQNGGSGFAAAWSGGNSTIVAGLASGGGSAVQIGTTSTRQLAATASTSGTSTYITYLMNASSFTGGNFTGLSLFNGATEEMFMGIPWQTQKFGFDAHAGRGVADIKSVNFTPLANTSYLVTLGLLQSATSGKVDVKMWATSNLSINPNTLVAGAPNAELLGVKNNFSFNSIRLSGDYAGSLKTAGIASSPSVSEAAAATMSAVPEIDPAGFGSVAAILTGAFGLIERRRKRA